MYLIMPTGPKIQLYYHGVRICSNAYDNPTESLVVFHCISGVVTNVRKLNIFEKRDHFGRLMKIWTVEVGQLEKDLQVVLGSLFYHHAEFEAWNYYLIIYKHAA